MTQVQDSVWGTITRVYDGLDRLTSETTPQGTVTYGYDLASRLTTLQVPGQSQVTYGYDTENRLTSIVQGSTSVAFGYDLASRRTSATLPTGITATYAYDAASQVSSITYANGSTALGNMNYIYDLAGRVTTRMGTLMQAVLPAPVSSAAYNASNQLTSRVASGVTQTPTWDLNGSLTSDGVNPFTWDARNRMTQIGASGATASFTYDGFNRRSSATRSGTATAFLYAGDEIVQEQQGGAASANILLGLGTDERISRAGETYLTDTLGSTYALASGSAIQTNYTYTAYGVATASGTASTNSFQFTGRENDGTAAGLMYYRARYYNPLWGQFVSEDPIGVEGGWNLYGYVNQAPVNFKDPNGLCIEDACIGETIAIELTIELYIEYQQRVEQEKYHRICNEPAPSNLCSRDLLQWKLNKARACASVRASFAERWFNGGYDSGHQIYMNELQKQINNLEEQLR